MTVNASCIHHSSLSTFVHTIVSHSHNYTTLSWLERNHTRLKDLASDTTARCRELQGEQAAALDEVAELKKRINFD